MERSKWHAFMNDPRFRLEDLGRAASFLVPVKKLKWKAGRETVEQRIHRFLFAEFGGFTTSKVPKKGIWKNAKKKKVTDKSRMYEVSFNGKERIPLLAAELAEIAVLIKEDCMYFTAGQYVATVWPRRRRS